MSTIAHTPGPYRITTDQHGHAFAWIEAGGELPIARVVLGSDDMSGYIPNSDRLDDDPQALANARLLAAAPELLDACEAALSYWADPSHQRSTTGLVSLLANAIAKAHAVGAHAPHWGVQP